MIVTYHGHSGFSVRTGRRLLIFDYLGEGLKMPEEKDRACVFVSHAHGDHFHPTVVEWMKRGRVRLITGEDVDAGGVRMAAGDVLEAEDVRVEAFGSTDQGVSFLVHADGYSIFHAGDFNLWHWKHESTEEEIRGADEAFEAILSTLRGRKMDLAFFPVDPRMGEGYEEGAVRFIGAVKPGCLIPMHFWKQPEAAVMMAEKPVPQGVRVCALTVPGENMELV